MRGGANTIPAARGDSVLLRHCPFSRVLYVALCPHKERQKFCSNLDFADRETESREKDSFACGQTAQQAQSNGPAQGF